jgi:hypothetical protein
MLFTIARYLLSILTMQEKPQPPDPGAKGATTCSSRATGILIDPSQQLLECSDDPK